MKDSEPLIRRITKAISPLGPFRIERSRCWEILNKEFSKIKNYNEIQNSLWNSAQNLIRQRLDGPRFKGLVLLSFLIELEEEQTRLIQLTTDLEKLLPQDSVNILEGIAYLFKRLSQLITVPFLPRILERCIHFLSNRLTQSAIQTSVLLLYNLSENVVLNELPNLIWNAIKYPIECIQETSVDLYLMHLSNFTYSDDLIKGMILICISAIQTNMNMGEKNYSEIYGALLVFKKLIEKKYDIMDTMFEEIFTIVSNLLISNPESNFLSTYVVLCKYSKTTVEKFKGLLGNVLNSIKDLRDLQMCKYVVEIAKEFPDDFGEFCYKRAKEQISISPDSYFLLISVKFGDYCDKDEIMKNFEEKELTTILIDTSSVFMNAFPCYTFSLIKILTKKLEDNLKVKPSLAYYLIQKMESNHIFPFEQYWEPLFTSFVSGNIMEVEEKQLLIKALLTIIRETNINQEEKIVQLLFYVKDETKSVILTLLNNIDSSILIHLENNNLLLLDKFYFLTSSKSIQISTIKLYQRLKKICPLSTFNFFIMILNKGPTSYKQQSLIHDRRKIIETWPYIIDAAGEFLNPFSDNLYDFFIELIDSKLSSPKTICEKLNFHETEEQDISIHIYALKCLEKLIKYGYKCDPQKIVNSVKNQILSYNNENIQQAGLITLHTIFSYFKIDKIDVESLIADLYEFMKVSKNQRILCLLLKVLGTIGPLDPMKLHMSTSSANKITQSLFEKSKREHCYLEFVMNYLLSQLESQVQHHVLLEYSVHLNAILYIFQFDAKKSSPYFSRLISVLKDLVTPSSCDSIFHIIRSIIIYAEIDICPFADSIVSMLKPYLQPSTSQIQLIEAIKTLSSIIFKMKFTFRPFTLDIFSMVLTILSQNSDMDTDLYLLQILTHLVIFSGGSQQLFFKQIKIHALKKNLISPNALNFLGQVISNTSYTDLWMPSINLALMLINEEKPIQESSISLLALLSTKCKQYFPKNIDINRLQLKQNNYEVSSDPYRSSNPPPICAFSASEEIEKSGVLTQFDKNNWETWLLHLSQNLVLCSNSPAIRACHPLLQLSSTFEQQIFPLILISVWEIASEEDRNHLSSLLLSVVQNSEIPIELLTIFSNTIEVMDRAGYTLFTQKDISNRIAESSGHLFRSLRLFECLDHEDDGMKCEMIRILAILQQRESALGIFKITPNAKENSKILQKLSLWSEAKKLYSPDESESAFYEYILCLFETEDWKVINNLSTRFEKLSPEYKKKCGIYFAIGAYLYSQDYQKYISYPMDNKPFQVIWNAIFAISSGQYQLARSLINKGIRINANDSSPFLSGNYQPTLPLVVNATFFEELNDVLDCKEKLVDHKIIESKWEIKADTSPISFQNRQIRFAIRGLLRPKDSLQLNLEYLNGLRKRKLWEIYDNVIERLVGERNQDERVRLLIAKVRYDRQICHDLSEIEQIIKIAKSPNVYANAVCSYATRLPTSNPEVLSMLQNIVASNPLKKRAWKLWTYGNLNYFNALNEIPYANNAIKGFTELIKLNGPHLHYLSQLCYLCFNYKTNIASIFDELSSESIEQIAQQLLAHFDHSRKCVRQSVTSIVSKLAEQHIQSLLFPLLFICKIQPNSKNLKDFYDEICNKYPKLVGEAKTVSNGLLSISLLDTELLCLKIDQLINKHITDQEIFTKEVQDILNIYNKKHIEIDYQLLSQEIEYGNSFHAIEKLLNSKQRLDMNSIKNKLYNICNSLTMKFETAVSELDINEIAPQLISNAPYHIAVPGYYKTTSSFPFILSIMKIVKIIKSAKNPRKIQIVGSDNKIYKYLLKGKEDLRVDQRVNQWFTLANSFLKENKYGKEKDLSIENYPIIPLSHQAGMMAWAEGGDTFYKLISWYHHISYPNIKEIEINVYREFGFENPRKNRANKIQRLEIYRKLRKVYPDNALREVIWVKSPSSAIWFKQKTNFARSLGLMSIVGYTIGLGDRHPQNILYMKKTGKAVHIDFGDCFEKAMNRPNYPEKVPFRLTPMMVKALGVSGVEGIFTITAQYVMSLLRRNKSSLLSFLDIFLREDKSSEETNAQFERVRDKLNGKEFEGLDEQTPEQQVGLLIKEASWDYNLSQMYYGWVPHW